MLRKLVIVSALSSLLISGGSAETSEMDAARRGAAYIVSRQLPNGGFFSDNNPADGVAEALAVISAVGAPRSSMDAGLSYIRDRGRERASRQGAYAARIIMGIVAAGADPRNFGEFNYVTLLNSFYNSETGAYDSSTVYADALALLGVAASGNTPPPKAIGYLRAHECPGGGFSHQANCTALPDSDTTAIALNALVASGVQKGDPIVNRTMSFLRSAQNEDGGFGAQPYSLDKPTNANSTGLVVSAIVSVGQEPTSWKKGRHDPITALVALQVSSGAFKYTATSSQAQDYATVQAIPGVAALSYPLKGASVDAPAKTNPTASIRTVEPKSELSESGSSPEKTDPVEVAASPPVAQSLPAGRETEEPDSRSPVPWLLTFMGVSLLVPLLIRWRKGSA